MRVEASRAGRTRRARVGCGMAAMTATAVVIAGTVVAMAFFLIAGRSTQVAASFIHAQAGAVRWNEHQQLTMLLIGRRSDASGSPAGTLALASYNPHTHSAALLGIPTNLWVSIPGYGPGRLGDALSDGGVREAVLTTESVLRIPIPYYAVTSPHTMAQLVDAFGGFTVRSPKSLTLNGTHFHAGVLHLNGAGALAYSSPAAADPKSTMEGLQRQMALLFALKRQSFTPQSFFRIPNVINALGGSVNTNFPYDQLLDLAHAVGGLPNNRLYGTSLSYSNNTVTGYETQATQVLLPDFQRITSVVKAEIGTPSLRGLGRVALSNGTGTPGQAAALGAWLRGDGVHVGALLSGPTNGYASTYVEVAVSADAPQRALASTVAILLQVPTRTVRKPVSRTAVSVIMGRDYQDPTQQ